MIKHLFNCYICSIVINVIKVNKIFEENKMAEYLLPHHHGDDADITSLSSQLSKINDFQIISDIFKQLGDPTRLRIFWFLCHKEECVTDIAFLMNMSSPAVSHHLKELKSSRLITARREGKEVHYKASDSAEAQMLHQMIETAMQISCPK